MSAILALSPRKLGPGGGHERIFAQRAYALVRTAPVVPAVHVEALDLAVWFPVVWQVTDTGPHLVALRSLLADGRGHPAGSPDVPASLPLVLRAYPFVAGPDIDPSREMWLDDTMADQPTDIGAPILDERGAPGRGTQQRMRAAAIFRAHGAQTDAMSRALGAGDAFEPWPLELDEGDHRIRIDTLSVLRPAILDSAFMRDFIREFGLRGARLVSAHALSLFRAGVLFGAARAALRTPAA